MSTTFANGTTYPFPSNAGFNPNSGPYGWSTCPTTGNTYPTFNSPTANFTNPNFINPNFTNSTYGPSLNTTNPFSTWNGPVFGSPTPPYFPSFFSPSNPFTGTSNSFVNTIGSPSFIPTPWGFMPSFPMNSWSNPSFGFNPFTGFNPTNWINPTTWINSNWNNTTPGIFNWNRGIPFTGAYVPSFNPVFPGPNFGGSQGIFGTSMFNGFPGFPTAWFNPGPFGYQGVPSPAFNNTTNNPTYQNGTDKTGSCCVGLAA